MVEDKNKRNSWCRNAKVNKLAKFRVRIRLQTEVSLTSVGHVKN